MLSISMTNAPYKCVKRQSVKLIALQAMMICALSACATTAPIKKTDNFPIDIANAPIAKPEPTAPVDPIKDPHFPPPMIEGEPISPVPDDFENGFDGLSGWVSFDARPAFSAVLGSCAKWKSRKPDQALHKTIGNFGAIQDWLPACHAANTIRATQTTITATQAREFFQTNFAITADINPSKEAGMMTGYYAPEIEVRRHADTTFYEPILAKPASKIVQNLPRADIGPMSSTVLAYGRPIDVFFLQIQGSGRLRFADGTRYRAAFAGHNSQTYRSIGKALVARGEMKLSEASKQSIENWMERAGPQKAKALMDENPRYVFFKTEHLITNRDGTIQGPKGAMGVPLTPMASIAVDPKTTGYGALIWMETKLPQQKNDYQGKTQNVLAVAQDTGGAIKGPHRADLFFGAGTTAGDLAGVMKHDVKWTYLLPAGLAYRLSLLIS